MKETSKAMTRRLHDIRFATRYFVGDGIDIGAGKDPVWLYKELYPNMKVVKDWDLKDGDAQNLNGIPTDFFGFVHSSHCLEHMVNPFIALKRWFEVLKPGGHMICIIPDEDLYEQGVFPSTFNADHKWTFTINKTSSWSSHSINILELLSSVGELCEIIKIELLDATYRYGLPRLDQTFTPVGESAIEFIIRKRTSEELEQKGRLPNLNLKLTKEVFGILSHRD